jgi:hypothetical protein
MDSFFWLAGVVAVAFVSWRLLRLIWEIIRIGRVVAHHHVWVIRNARTTGRSDLIKWRRLPSSCWGLFWELAAGITTTVGQHEWSANGYRVHGPQFDDEDTP